MRIRFILSLTLIAALALGALAWSQVNSEPDLLAISDEMIQATIRLRGLESKASIQKGVKSREEIEAFLNERVRTEYSQGALEKEGRLLRKLGLIPADMNYRDFLIKLLTEQVGGYYDSDRETFFIASWLPADDQKPVMVHELTHALQDQHFDIAKILKEDRDSDNDDRALAHQAILEGDARVVMLQYLLEPAKRHFSQLPNLAFIMQSQMLTMQSQFPTFKTAPSFLQDAVLFPYGYGASFMQYSWSRNPSWPAINKIYSDLPASTEQILHPEKYFITRDVPKPINADFYLNALGGNWKAAYRNVLGEFSLGLLLSLHLTEEHARKAATGWGGDQVLLLEDNAGRDAALISTTWDTAEDAEKFFAAMDEWFRRHYPDAPRSNATPTGFSVPQDGEVRMLRRDGLNIRCIIGLPEAESGKLKDF